MLNKTYRRIACTIACCVPDCGTARRRRNAYEKSARENKLAIPMNTRSGRGTPRNVTRSGFGGLGSRVGSFTNITMRTEMTAGIAARKRIIRYEPSTVIAAPTVVRKNGRMGRIISLLMSVKSDTTPSTTTFAVRPYARVRRVTAMPSRRMEEERHRNHRVHHDEQGPLVPIAAAVGHHGGHDGGREDQGRELENLEVEGHRLREEQRNEHEDGGHEERDLRRGRRGHGHAELHLVPVRH